MLLHSERRNLRNNIQRLWVIHVPIKYTQIDKLFSAQKKRTTDGLMAKSDLFQRTFGIWCFMNIKYLTDFFLYKKQY